MEFTAITGAVTAAGSMIVGLIGDCIGVVMEHPLLLLPVGVTFVGIGFAYAKSMIRV